MFTIRRIGSSVFPVAFAGQLSVHRPHSVHANPSRSWRKLSCSTRRTPNDSVFSRSTDLIAPFGSRFTQNELNSANSGKHDRSTPPDSMP